MRSPHARHPHARRTVRAAILIGALATAGCGAPVLTADPQLTHHQISLTVTATEESVELTANVNGQQRSAAGETKATPISTASVATMTVVAPTGVQVSLTGGPPESGLPFIAPLGSSAATPNQITCTISVDGVQRSSTTVTGGLGELPQCHASGFIGHRALGFGRILEFVALAVCLLIVLAAVGAQVVTNRQA